MIQIILCTVITLKEKSKLCMSNLFLGHVHLHFHNVFLEEAFRINNLQQDIATVKDSTSNYWKYFYK